MISPGSHGISGIINMDLRSLSEEALLDLVLRITSKPGPMTPLDKEELLLVEEEFVRREGHEDA